jgi:hypothetical protein
MVRPGIGRARVREVSGPRSSAMAGIERCHDQRAAPRRTNAGARRRPVGEPGRHPGEVGSRGGRVDAPTLGACPYSR